jgi:hypothetical protein
VDFDALRAMGLSITQANRLLAAREKRSGFGSVEELDTLAGFPRDVIVALKRRLGG